VAAFAAVFSLGVAPAFADPPGSVLEAHGYTMIEVKPGTWARGGDAGDADELPVHTVTVSRALLFGTTEVTQRLYEGVMAGANPAKTEGRNWRGRTSGGSCAQHGVGDRFPVTCVTWEEAVAFCNRLSGLEGLTPAYRRDASGAWHWDGAANGYRLPTEAEWELGARTGGARATCSHANVANPSSVAHATELGMVPQVKTTFDCDDGTPGLAPVGSRAATEGLYDVLGNLWEWTWDGYGPYPEGSVTDPAPSGDGSADRVLRGGSWANPPSDLRVDNRFKGPPDGRSYLVGFRIVRSLGAPPDAPPTGTPEVDAKLERRVGPDLARKAAELQAAFEAARTDAHLALVWRRARELTGEMVDPLFVEYERLEAQGRGHDLNFDWIDGAIPGLKWSYGAEGMGVVLFLQSQPWIKRADQTEGSADDVFFELMDWSYGMMEPSWAVWQVRTWDYGGCSALGTGVVFAGLSLVDRALLAGPTFGDEIAAIRADLLRTVLEGDEYFPYCDPEKIGEPTPSAGLREEAQRILGEIKLSEDERKALEARIPKLQGAEHQGG